MKIKSKNKLFITIISISLVLSIFGCAYFILNFENASDTSVEASKFNDNQDQLATTTAATSTTSETLLIPMGTTFGIKLYTDGVIVTALQTITTTEGSFCPAKDAGIKTGDYIVEANGIKIESNQQLSEIIGESENFSVDLTLRRDGEYMDTCLNLISDGKYLRAGMWIRDSAAGIGTITYYNTQTGKFAGLGHPICDVDTNTIMNISGGEPAEIAISSLTKSAKNNPGKINGYFSGGSLGILTGNSNTGVFGVLDEIPTGEAYPTASVDEIKTGEATILATLDNTGVKEYSVYIEKIDTNPNKETKNMVVSVTDPELLEKTGGIIQGMSGCPIIQNGKIVGAVTHVFVDNPQMGYGIFIENMIKNEISQ